MPRSVNAVASRARRKRILKGAKGFYGKRKNVYTVAKNVLEKGLTYRYVGRKLKKREYRALWIARINAAVRTEGITYSAFIHKLHQKGIGLDRKVLADLAVTQPEVFAQIVEQAKSGKPPVSAEKAEKKTIKAATVKKAVRKTAAKKA